VAQGFQKEIGDMKKTILRMVLLMMFGLFFCLNSTVIASGETADPIKLDKIKIGMTEPEVKAILGEPSTAEDKIKYLRGGRELLELRVLSYGSGDVADLIFFSKKTGKVYKVVPH
jgi:hypothetical protein